MAEIVAGHTFKCGPDGKEVCECGKAWIDIAGATKADVGKNGWAHQGVLSDHELGQIEARRERLWRIGMGVSSVEKAA